MSARSLQRLLERELGYSLHSQRGSHKKLRSTRGYAPLLFSFHDGQEIPPGLVRKILTKDVGLDEHEALDLLG